jgi:hypothetical protein
MNNENEVNVCVPLHVFRQIYITLYDAKERIPDGTLCIKHLLVWIESERSSTIEQIREEQ